MQTQQNVNFSNFAQGRLQHDCAITGVKMTQQSQERARIELSWTVVNGVATADDNVTDVFRSDFQHKLHGPGKSFRLV